MMTDGRVIRLCLCISAFLVLLMGVCLVEEYRRNVSLGRCVATLESTARTTQQKVSELEARLSDLSGIHTYVITTETGLRIQLSPRMRKIVEAVNRSDAYRKKQNPRECGTWVLANNGEICHVNAKGVTTSSIGGSPPQRSDFEQWMREKIMTGQVRGLEDYILVP